MKTTISVRKEVDIKTLEVHAGVRYWEDSEVNGKEDTNGDLIPCRNGEYWEPIINVDSGIITNWEKGKTADIHYNVCDDGVYTLKDINGETIFHRDDMYVPECLSGGDSDYIIMVVDENGKIEDWQFGSKEISEIVFSEED